MLPRVARVSRLGAEVDVIGLLAGRYFGLRAFGQIYGCLFAIFTLGTGLGPVLMAVSFDVTQSYDVTLTGFGVALVCASVLVSRLGPYRFPARRVSVDRQQSVEPMRTSTASRSSVTKRRSDEARR